MIFFDVEASGLGPSSFPIEIGWAIVGGSTESLLIRSHAEWLSWSDAWDPNAEALHGLSRDRLLAEGLTVDDAARRLNSALSGQVLVSDSPQKDFGWLSVLYEWAEVGTPNFTVSQVRAETIIVDLAQKLGIQDLEYTFAERETTRLAPKTHRAAVDAAYWATFYSLLQLGQEELARLREAAGGGPAFGSLKWRG